MEITTRVLFVCTGNICRSPTAEAVARKLLDEAGLSRRVVVDSAGTHGYHIGEPPDRRSQKAAQQRGYDLSGLRARKLEGVDFQHFDLLLAMDDGHLHFMQRVCPAVYRHKLDRFMRFAPALGRDDVPDPYFDGDAGFELVLDYCEAAVRGLLDSLRSPPTDAA